MFNLLFVVQVFTEYMMLINAQADSIGIKSYCFPTFLMEKIVKDGYEAVKTWGAKAAKNAKLPCLFSFDRLVFPVNISNTHWVIMVAHMRARKIIYHDSLPVDTVVAEASMQALNR